ncbi:MAG: Biopolymer transport protein ExbD [Herbaspirillum frisingense]|uniref:Biopolymer transport protein ExbD n=1 Tax=Herbaspirillum frisingense TaxID=92645 RepID=A0A7V8JTF1_9BURK|nr:MAG: Biopolymer transport protein ExbD [Herbaspirillum frisingense]
MNFRKGRPREDLEINLIPFIDVLLVIVIFLMVTTTYSKFTALQITLPTADAQKALEQPFEVNIAVDANGRYAINNNRIAARDAQGLSDEMQAAVKNGGAKGDPVIIINADALATHQTVVNVLEAARIAGYPKVTFAAQSSGGK